MTQISKEYATALFQLAQECGSEEAYRQALVQIDAVFDENPAYSDLLSSPGIPKSERCESIKTVFGTEVPEQILSFLMLLCEQEQIHAFHAICEDFSVLTDNRAEILRAEVYSAVPLTEEEKVLLGQKLEAKSGKSVTMHFEVDPGLLGGIKVVFDDRVIDGTLKRRLYEMKEVMNR